jgi:3-hydroxyisobutyrate dehydrogenase-like beta-hydroxyacid dehydrogenase
MTLRAGFIGLGNLGKPLASHLAPKGFETTVYDIAEEPVRELVEGGAKQARSPREVAERSDVIGICVPEDHHVLGVMMGEDGVLAGAAQGSVVALHSTILPATVLELAERSAPHGVSVLDACVTGGDQRAAQGVVTYLVGGNASVLEKARPFLDASSENVILAMASGLPAEVFESAGRSNGQLTDLTLRYLTTQKLPLEARLSDGYQAYVRRHMHTAEKDLAWALRLARDSELALPVSGLVSQLMARIYGVEDEGRR